MTLRSCILPLVWALVAATPAEADAADVCVLVSSGSKKTRPTYDAVARVVVAETGGVRVEGSALNDPATVQKSCRRVAVAIGVKALKVAHKHLAVPTVYLLAQSAEQTLHDHPLRYGISATADPGSLFGVLQQIAPDVKRVGVVFDPTRTGSLVHLATKVAESRDIELVALEARDTAAAIKAFRRFEKEIRVDALWILPDSSVTSRETADYALKLALWGRLPVIGPSRSYVGNGALFALVPDPSAHGKLAAELANELLRGERPPSLQYAPENDLILSQRMADKLGLRLPAEMVKRAKELIR